MAHVFISYSRKDKAFAYELESKLGSTFPIWMDKGMGAGKSWRDEIEYNIRSSFALVLIITPRSMESEVVNYEWVFARGVGVEVIPIYLEAIEVFPYRLADLNYLDFREGYDWVNLFEQLRKTAEQYISLEPINQAMQALNSPFPSNRKNGIDTLVHLNARDGLALAVQHDNRGVRIDAGIALAELSGFQDKRALRGLVDALDVGDLDLRLKAAKMIGELRDDNAVAPLLNKLYSEPEWSVRFTIADALGKIGEAAVPGLLEAIAAKSSDVREQIARVLSLFRRADTIQGLLTLLEDKEVSVRKQAAKSLGNIADSSAIPQLLKASHDPSWEVRGNIILALGSIKSEEAVPRLLEALADEEPEVGGSAAFALGQIGLPALVRILDSLKSLVGNARLYAAKAIGYMNDVHCVPLLLDILCNSENFEVLNAATIALGNIGSPSVPGLLEILKDKNSKGRSSATASLGTIGDKSTFPYLLQALEDEDIHVQAVSATYIGKFKDPTAIPPLTMMLSDSRQVESPPILGFVIVRNMSDIASNALQDIGTAEALSAIRKRLSELSSAKDS